MSERPTLIHLVHSNKWGGVQQYALDICRHFRQQGWEVAAMTRDARVIDDRFREHDIELFHGPLQGYFDPSSARILARRLKTAPRGRTVIHVHRYRDGLTALIAALIARRPDVRIVSTRHTVRRGRTSRLFRRIYDRIDAHIFVSRTAFESFRRTGFGELPIKPGKVHILFNSINIEPLVREPEPERGPVFALYAGPVVKGKGIETIIDAMALTKGLKLRLRIAGHGNPDYLDLLRRRAMARNVMDLIDWNNGSEPTPELFAQSHFTVLPSVEREGFGLSNLRSMAAGRPQICTTSGAQNEYLEHGETAIFVPAADAQALAEAMKRLARDTALRERMGKAAFRHFSESLSWEKFASRLTEIYVGADSWAQF